MWLCIQNTNTLTPKEKKSVNMCGVFQGGGWCNNVTTCLDRKNTRLGSSKQMTKVLSFSGMFSNKAKFNPGQCFSSVILVEYFI